MHQWPPLQVAAATERVTRLRQTVTGQVVEAVAAQAEVLRPVMRAGEMTLSTPGAENIHTLLPSEVGFPARHGSLYAAVQALNARKLTQPLSYLPL